jgi:hypothetical protein
MEFFKCIKYIFAKKTSKLENFVVSSKNVITDIHLKQISTLVAKKSCFSPQVNFPQDKVNILSIWLKSGKHFLDNREDIPSGKLSFRGRVKIFFLDSREKFPY